MRTVTGLERENPDGLDDAEYLYATLFSTHGSGASNAAIWYLIRDDDRDVTHFLEFMTVACNDEVAYTCASILEDDELMPVLQLSTLDRLFGEGYGHGADTGSD